MMKFNFRGSPLRIGSYIVILAITVVLYQNCSGGGFSAVELSSPTTESVPLPDTGGNSPPDSSPDPTPAPPPPPPPPGGVFDISQLKVNHAVELAHLGACPPGAGTASGCGAMTDYGSMVFDDQSQKFFMFGGGHGPGQSTSLFAFDLRTQVWGVAYQGDDTNDWNTPDADAGCFFKTSTGPFTRHTYDMMPIVKNAGGFNEILMLTNGGWEAPIKGAQINGETISCQVGHFDPKSSRWTYYEEYPGAIYSYASVSEFDPISKKVIIIGTDPQMSGWTAIYTYDPSTKKIQKAKDLGVVLGIDNNMVYYPPNDRFYLIRRGGEGNRVYEVALDRTDLSLTTVTEVSMSGAPYGEGPGAVTSGWAYDPDQKVIAGGIRDNRFYFFDPLAKAWGSIPISIQAATSAINHVAFHVLAYDSINKIYVFVDGQTKMTWALKFSRP